MKENISKVMDRGERLETLEEKSGKSVLLAVTETRYTISIEL